MPEFYVTFGQKYRYESHLTCKEVHPDGYITIIAENEEQAREIAFQELTNQWSMLCAEEPSKEYFPRGNIKTFDRTV